MVGLLLSRSYLITQHFFQSNDTLANNGCPLHKALHLHWQWAERFTSPIASRLQRQVTDYDITALDILILMSMCPFQSVADERVSKFCNLFTEQEFRQYEYFNVSKLIIDSLGKRNQSITLSGPGKVLQHWLWQPARACFRGWVCQRAYCKIDKPPSGGLYANKFHTR